MVMNALLKKENCPPQVTPALRTEFMDAFEARFVTNKERAWLLEGATSEDVARDLETFAYALMDRGTRFDPEATVMVLGLNLELFTELTAFMNGYRNPGGNPTQFWPLTTPVAKETNTPIATLRLWEISVCLDRVLHEASDVLSVGGGGGLPKWPPV